jgi:hypothetical protein
VRTEGVPDDGVVLVRDQQQSNGVSVLRPAELVIDECDVETELAEVLRLELPGLELDHDVPELFDVKEEQVDVEVISVEGEGEGEGEGEEVQHIRVLRDLLRQIPPPGGSTSAKFVGATCSRVCAEARQLRRAREDPRMGERERPRSLRPMRLLPLRRAGGAARPSGRWLDSES